MSPKKNDKILNLYSSWDRMIQERWKTNIEGTEHNLKVCKNEDTDWSRGNAEIDWATHKM